ncbi:MAG: phosphate ABC transporter permease subunit PstC [Hyphomicrobiales bacterium]
MIGFLFLTIIILVVAGFFTGRRRGYKFDSFSDVQAHSRPAYHGAYVALWVGIPAISYVLVWLLFQNSIIDAMLRSSLDSVAVEGLDDQKIQLMIAEVKQVARGQVFGEPSEAVFRTAEAYKTFQSTAKWALFVSALALGMAGGAFALGRLAPRFRARHGVERIVRAVMVLCCLVALLTTAGIVFSLLFEAMRFFRFVSPVEFFFGLNWEPQIAIRADQVASNGSFGAVPVFTGTILIAFIAMLVAIPIGLFSAIYLTEYANPRFRAYVKPLLEILAGIPTVVYGFFAVLIVAPALRSAGAAVGLDVAPNGALAAGAVMGIMIIPFVSSLSDDALGAVPSAMREGSYGLGATKAETITQVLLPAALPGIVGGILLAVSRAIGETMIAVMAAGLIANLTANPFEGVTTVTVQIVTLLIGDTEFDSPKTLAAFALGLTLFVATLCLNVAALKIVQKYREKYD